MIEVIFLIVLGLAWIVFASVSDLRTREVLNWLNFSLIIFALGFRFFYSLFSNDFGFFYQGLIGLGIFFIIGNLLYYGRMFAGGDAKLMIALGAVLPFSENFFVNVELFLGFFLVFLFAGAFYGLFFSLYLGVINYKKFRKEFSQQFRKGGKIFYVAMLIGILTMVFGFVEGLFVYMGFLIFILPLFYLYAKSVEEVCLVKKIKVEDLTEGDWLYEDLRVGKKILKKNWDGLSKEDISQIKRYYKKIKIKQGIPYVPVFLISFIIFIIIYFSGNSYWRFENLFGFLRFNFFNGF